jgi:hypothetical protein
MQVGEGVVMMSGVMNKVRNCDYRGIGAVAVYNTGESDSVPIWTQGNGTGDRYTRPTGTQAWGPWAITIPVSPETVAIKFDLVHQCHFLWSSGTELGLVPLVRPK